MKDDNRETKSRRVNLMITPSSYRDIVKIAVMNQVRPNEQMGRAINECIERNRDLIEKYDKTFGDLDVE